MWNFPLFPPGEGLAASVGRNAYSRAKQSKLSLRGGGLDNLDVGAFDCPGTYIADVAAWGLLKLPSRKTGVVDQLAELGTDEGEREGGGSCFRAKQIFRRDRQAWTLSILPGRSLCWPRRWSFKVCLVHEFCLPCEERAAVLNQWRCDHASKHDQVTVSGGDLPGRSRCSPRRWSVKICLKSEFC